MVPEGHVPGRPDLGLSVGTGMRCWTLGVGAGGGHLQLSGGGHLQPSALPQGRPQ